MPDQRTRDEDQLRLLAILHFVLGGLAAFGLVLLVGQYAVFQSLMSSPEVLKGTSGGAPPPEVFGLIKWAFLLGGLSLLAGGAANVLSGLFILRRRNRLFSLIVAGINCLQVPIGTALGVFTFVVLLRDSVLEVYDQPSQIPNPFDR